MKALAATLALLSLAASIQTAEARTYSVKYMGEKAMAGICSGNGVSGSGENSYSCTYPNGNIRECNRQTKKCITETPN
ncbi:MAG: hypothetical protein ABIQ30_13845 [Devosia sp.]